MKKQTKLYNLIGAVVGFNVETPQSGVGEQEQYVVVKITGVFKAKSNGQYYVKGIALKRQTNSQEMAHRQYQIGRIVNRTLVIIADNEWSLSHPVGKRMRRLGDSRVRKYIPPAPLDGNQLKAGLSSLRDSLGLSRLSS